MKPKGLTVKPDSFTKMPFSADRIRRTKLKNVCRERHIYLKGIIILSVKNSVIQRRGS